MTIQYYHYPHEYNVGDTIAPHILKYFLPEAELVRVGEAMNGKLLSVGSVMKKITPNDIVWGTGIMRERDVFDPEVLKTCRFIAVRGPKTRRILRRYGADVPCVYGDPGLLLPRLYHPKIEKTHKVGIVPHYVDKKIVLQKYATMTGYNKIIDVALPWKQFVEEVLSCESIISSSLHGIIIAEAYGIPAEWAVYSDKVIGNGFKFLDYLEATGRPWITGPGVLPNIPYGLTTTICDDLVAELQDYFKGRKDSMRQ